MTKFFFLLLVVLTIFCCGQKRTKVSADIDSKFVISDTVPKAIDSATESKEILTGFHDFTKVLDSLPKIKNTKDEHQDWMSNSTGFLDKLFEINAQDLIVSSNSYTYQDECVFYIHNLKHSNDSISIKSFVENAQGKRTEGYTQLRVLIFAMKNKKEANFIDIPIVYNNTQLDNELIEKVYSEIDFKVIACDSLQICRMKNLGD